MHCAKYLESSIRYIRIASVLRILMCSCMYKVRMSAISHFLAKWHKCNHMRSHHRAHTRTNSLATMTMVQAIHTYNHIMGTAASITKYREISDYRQVIVAVRPK